MIYTQPSDVGFGCIARRRAFTAFLRVTVYDKLCQGLRDAQLSIENLVSGTPYEHVQLELQSMKNSRKTPSGLTDFELGNLEQYQTILDARGVDVRHQIFVPMQNPLHCMKAAKDGVLPAFTATDRLVWIRDRSGPLLPTEKFLGHGWPLTEELSQILGVPATWLDFCHIL